MKPSDNPADPFKKALAEATKVMADDPELAVTYSVDPPGLSKDSVRLPQISRRMTRDEVLLARGTADALALRHKFHDPAVSNRYLPQGQLARDIYDAMETARIEAMGARYMPGTASNIDAKIGAEARRKGYEQVTEPSGAPLSVAAGYLIRHLATGRPLPKGADNVMELWRGFIEDQAGETLENRLIRIEDTTIHSAVLDGRTARIAVSFVADIASVTRDKDGNVIAGSLDDAIESRDVWTFMRDTRSQDPNWLLDETDAG